MILLRVVGGLMGALLLLGSLMADPPGLTMLLRLGIGGFGLGLLVVAFVAPDRLIERWFGGL